VKSQPQEKLTDTVSGSELFSKLLEDVQSLAYAVELAQRDVDAARASTDEAYDRLEGVLKTLDDIVERLSDSRPRWEAKPCKN
jgi:hypothetical protein